MGSLLVNFGFATFVLIASLVDAMGSPDPLLGISPIDEQYFKSDIIKCKDGSNSFVRGRLNDGFCDCPDGTDEPGTSACPEGRFFCKNAGHLPLNIFSSRVNDGICDCCDGSDEYDGTIECRNTCWEDGKAARDKLKKKIATFQEGAAVRKQEIKQSKLSIAKEEEELSKLQNDEKLLKDLVAKLKEQKQQIEKAEEEERQKKEKEAQKVKEAEEKLNVQVNQSEETLSAKPDEGEEDDQAHQSKDTLSTTELDENNEEGHVDQPDETPSANPDEILEESFATPEQNMVEDDDLEDRVEPNDNDAHSENSSVEEEQKDNKEVLSKEELGRLVASRWTGLPSDGQAEELDRTPSVQEGTEFDIPESRHAEEYDGYQSDGDEYDKEYTEGADPKIVDEEDDEEEEEEESDDHGTSESPERDDATDSDLSTIGESSWLGKIRHVLQEALHSLNLFKAPVNISDAARVRKEYDDYNSKLQKIQSRISSLSQKLKADLGPEKEFYPFYGHCFESKQNKYVYKVCPFKQASHVEGHSTTRLGQWEKFEESHRIMQFSNGDRCWNGPDRSLKVKLRCGVKNEFSTVDEPSRCEYEALMSTPALCLDERLKELQDQLNSMNAGRTLSHDEL